ncbi:MAG: hypothetical protein AB1540_12770 [Bdellovibrionota bacterium]
MLYFPLWESKAPSAWIKSDIAVAVAVMIIAHMVRRIWLEAKANQFILDDTREEAEQNRIIFDKLIKSFVAPVLIQKIEKICQETGSIAEALDSVLKRTRTKASVLYSDVRNFSSRSNNLDFIEKELIPSAVSILDPAEENLGVARQVADAVLIYYSLPDPEESILRALKDAIRCSLYEHKRISALGRTQPERYFTITFGDALVGNIASVKHREPTIIGNVANLATRIDGLTRELAFTSLFPKEPVVLLSSEAFRIVETFSPTWESLVISLDVLNITLKSYPNERSVIILPAIQKNISTLNALLRLNDISELKVGNSSW